MTSPWRRVTVFLVAGFMVLLFTAFYPYRQLRVSQDDLRRSRQVLLDQEHELADLKRQIQLLHDPAQIERLARERFGLVRRGEIPFVVEDDGPSSR